MVTKQDLGALYLMYRPRPANQPFRINYAEQFVGRMLTFREGRARKRDLVMGGMVTILARSLVPGFHASQVDSVSPEILLNEQALVTAWWLSYLDEGSDKKFRWFVGDAVLGTMVSWIELPDPTLTRLDNSPRPNAFWIPQAEIEELPPVKRVRGSRQPRSRPSAQPSSSSQPPQPSEPSQTQPPPSLQSVLDHMTQLSLQSQEASQAQFSQLRNDMEDFTRAQFGQLRLDMEAYTRSQVDL